MSVSNSTAFEPSWSEMYAVGMVAMFGKIHSRPAGAAGSHPERQRMEWKNRIHLGDARNLSMVPSESVHLAVTSPPYNVGIEYDNYEDNLELEAWLDGLVLPMAREVYRVLAPGGRFCMNVANTDRRPYNPLSSLIDCAMISDVFMREGKRDGWLMRGHIIWVKGETPNQACQWGSWRSASNPVLRDRHEYIMCYTKRGNERHIMGRPRPAGVERYSCSAEDFRMLSDSVWTFAPSTDRRHPAPFPYELPRRCIAFFSFPGDVVLDPMAGIGTTCLAARDMGRDYIGVDISEEYVRIARHDIANKPPRRIAVNEY